LELGSKLIKELRALLSFLTILPVGATPLNDAARGFYLVSIVGAVEGLTIGLTIYSLLHIIKDRCILAALYIAIHLIITRGLHLDGFADYCDAIGSLKHGAEALEVMMDPRKGTFAITLLFTNMILTYVAVSNLVSTLSSTNILILLTLIYVLNAEAMYILSALGIPEPYAGLAKEFVENAKKRANIVKNIVITMGIIFLITTASPQLKLLTTFIVLATVITCAVIAYDVAKRLGFVNGDVLGFCYETVRVVNLVLVNVFSQYL